MCSYSFLGLQLCLVAITAVSGVAAQETCGYPATSVSDVAASAGLTSLVGAFQASNGFSEVFASPVDSSLDLTLLAPSNSAIAAVAASLEPADGPALDALLALHIVSRALNSTQLMDGMELTTLTGQVLTVSITGGTVTIQGPVNNATVTQADVPVCNSIIHVLDAVLLPAAPLSSLLPGATTEAQAGAVTDVLEALLVALANGLPTGATGTGNELTDNGTDPTADANAGTDTAGTNAGKDTAGTDGTLSTDPSVTQTATAGADDTTGSSMTGSAEVSAETGATTTTEGTDTMAGTVPAAVVPPTAGSTTETAASTEVLTLNSSPGLRVGLATAMMAAVLVAM